MKVFYNHAMKVIYLDNVDLYKGGIITKEQLKAKKEACTIDRPLFYLPHIFSNTIKKNISVSTN